MEGGKSEKNNRALKNSPYHDKKKKKNRRGGREKKRRKRRRVGKCRGLGVRGKEIWPRVTKNSPEKVPR